MSEAKKVYIDMTTAWLAIEDVVDALNALPESEREALKPAYDMLNAVDNIIYRRLAARANALNLLAEVQS